MREGAAGRDTWAGKALLLSRIAERVLGAEYCWLFVLLSVHLFPLKKAKLK